MSDQQQEKPSDEGSIDVRTSDAIMANQLVLTCLSAMAAAHKGFPLEDYIEVVENVLENAKDTLSESEHTAITKVVNQILRPTRRVFERRKMEGGSDGTTNK